jgi:hypothetical protein
MEVMFESSNYAVEFDAFMRHFMTVQTGEIPKVNEVYSAFKNWILSNKLDRPEIAVRLHRYANYYTRIFLGRETDPELFASFADLVRLEATVTAPFLLEVYHDFLESGLLAKSDVLQLVHLIESYLIRRTVCSVPTNTLNSTFATLAKFIDRERYVESIQARFMVMGGNTRFPTDSEVAQIWPERDLYSTPKRLRYMLERLNNWGYNETNNTDNLSIEHILPQGLPLPQWWSESLGEDAITIRNKYVHTIGNLTLTGYNSELSNQSFVKKRDIAGGFRESAIRLNKILTTKATWGENEILERAQLLWKRASEIWKYPDDRREGTILSSQTLEWHCA